MTSSTPLHPLPSRAQLIKATAMAIAAAGLILVTVVLPAEHGIDPTGIGRKLGLLGMSAGVSTSEPASNKAPPVTTASTTVRNEYVIQGITPFHTGEMQVTLAPDKGAEIKAKMHKGEHFTFSWSTGAGPVEFDMHGEETNAANVFTSYWKGDDASGAGTFTAPFDGSHGWYWHNHGTEPVTVTALVSGFYSELYRP